MAHRSLRWTILFNAVSFSAATLASASSERILYNFPVNSLVQGSVQQDSRGDLYATAPFGYRAGAIYQLKNRGGAWHTRRIHVFEPDNGGSHPYAALASGPTDGTFYGTTTQAGEYNFGNVFSLVRSGRKWTESPLHQFEDQEGTYVTAPMTRDKTTGLLYGTASLDALFLCGSAFQIDPATQQYTKLYNFLGGADGCNPVSQMWPGSKPGTLFGSTLAGGHNHGGTLFLLTKKGRKWTNTVLHTFEGGNDGANPWDITAPADDGAQTIYGVAGGGQYGAGVVFQISQPGDKWVYKVIYTFTGGNDGIAPVSLLSDPKTGVLYGTTSAHGLTMGSVFELTNSGGKWTQSVLHNFTGGSTDGESPFARPLLDPKTGILYGTTTYGGEFNGGVVYAVTP